MNTCEGIQPIAPRWMSVALVLAGLYNILWGASVVLFPDWLFDLAAIEPPRYPGIWQCVGMIVGVYGIGYLAAATAPLRHWPITLVGLLGKILGPIGFLMAALGGELPWLFGITIITNDLIWWVPFTLILLAAYRSAAMPEQAAAGESTDFRSLLAEYSDDSGRSLLELSNERPRLVVFLRHSGCTFCREAVRDIARKRAEIEKPGTGIVIVHMGSGESMKHLLETHGLGDLPLIRDEDSRLYDAFGLQRGNLRQLFGPKVWWRGLLATLRGNILGKPDGDPFRMPGVFLLDRGRIARAFRHRTAADRPDYENLACPISA